MADWGLTRKQVVMLAVLVFGTFVTVLNQTVVAPALPSIMSEMSVDAAVAQWLTTGFTLVNAIMVPITAFLTDRFTTRRLFLGVHGPVHRRHGAGGLGPELPRAACRAA